MALTLTDGAIDPARIRALAETLVTWPSIGGTQGEADFAPRLRDLLGKISYFRDNPDDLILTNSHGDPMTQNLVAIVRGEGARAMVLAGHYDTVSIESFHDLAPLACQPDALHVALLKDMTGRALSPQESRAKADLESGDFLCGRGMLDMKSGLAAGIAVLEAFANQPHRNGNLILVVTPDEERESRGMRALRRDLPRLTRGLHVVGAVNMDVTSDQGDGAQGRAVYEGTIGKLLPFAYVIGQPAHAAYPFEGISAALIGAEILRAIEGNPALADMQGDIAPPPICLEARDTRSAYEVTTPERFWLSFNWLYQSGDAQTRLHQFRTQIDAALARATAYFAQNARGFDALSGKTSPQMAPARTLTLAELRARALSDPAKAQSFAAFEASLQIDNPLTLSQRLTDWLVTAADLRGPSVVIGFAGLHYPPSRLDPSRPDDARLRRAIDQTMAEYADDPTKCLTLRPYFQGISDMSFLGQPARNGDAVVAQNTPAARLVDQPAPDALSFPSVNIGPWGREFHQKLERVHAPYAFEVLPRILRSVVQRALG